MVTIEQFGILFLWSWLWPQIWRISCGHCALHRCIYLLT